MNKPFPAAVLALVAASAIGVVLWRWRTAEAPASKPAPASPAASARSTKAPATAAPVVDFGAVESALRAGAAGSGAQILEALRRQLAALPPEAAGALIRAHLASGRDAASGLGFKLGPGGALLEAPSLRTFLLEELARLDPAGAAAAARTVLATPTSADEWAVALRNVARVERDEAGRAFLEGKMRELLTHEPWQRDTSVGYLEAFDVAVHLRATTLAPELTALVRQTNNRALSHAAYLALDRLTIESPAALLARLADEPGLMTGREVTRANYFARADVSDAAQRAVLERFLLDARRTPAELTTFAGLYPNANFMISQNLLTQVNTPDHATLRARDRAALQVIGEWMEDPRFALVRASLEQARTRLKHFVQQ